MELAVSQMSEVAHGPLDSIGFVMHIYQQSNVTYILIENKIPYFNSYHRVYTYVIKIT